MITEPVRPLLIVGGNLALDLANTIDGPDPHVFDHLGTPERLLTWSRDRELLTDAEYDQVRALAAARPDRARRSLTKVHHLRRAVQSGFTALALQQTFPSPAWRTLRSLIAEAVHHAELSGNPPRLAWPATTLDRAGYAAAHAAHQLLEVGDLNRLKRCTDCDWLFLDRSRNNSRRWCTMEICGTSSKIRRYVERRAASRRPPGQDRGSG